MSGMEYPVADRIVDVTELLQWAGRARAEIDRLRAERDAAEQRGRAAERAAIVAYLRDHRDVADRRGGQHVGTGPSPSVARFVRLECEAIEAGEHIWGDR